ncbi:sensor domain-containing protein, partial [Wenjunlia tyrosinilytica]|uniref:sensor domain-containing protein n=1 Tax=Wenjunlia tyrosinilytica TaxID=1544741 RepID=UPI00166F30C4
MATAYQPAPRKHLVPTALRAPLEGRTWRELVYLLLNLPVGIAAFVWTVTMVSLGAGLLITFVGVPVLALALLGCRGLGVIERARARSLLHEDVPEPGPLQPNTRGLLSRMGALFKSGVSWRHTIYSLLMLPWGIFTFTVTTVLSTCGWGMLTYPVWQWVFPRYIDQPGLQLYGDETGRHNWYMDSPAEIAGTAALGLLVWMGTPWFVRGMAHVDRLMVRGLLSPSYLAERVQELESDRGTVVDTAAADLRRIERDLHDGAQARL